MGIVTTADFGRSLINPALNNIIPAEPEIIDAEEVLEANAYYGQIPKSSASYYIFNTSINEEKKKKDKNEKKMSLKKAKEEIVERQSKINCYKAKLSKLNQSKSDDAQLITQINVKIHKEQEKIKKLERIFNIDANMYTPANTNVNNQPTTFKDKWNEFWQKVKEFIANYSKEIASIASVAALIMLIIFV